MRDLVYHYTKKLKFSKKKVCTTMVYVLFEIMFNFFIFYCELF